VNIFWACERLLSSWLIILSSLLGRPAEKGRRELILSRGRYGYIAKYRWLPAEDIGLILAVRHQLEAGYAGE
jgi:hypothetical protein